MDRKFVLINIILYIKNTKIKLYETLSNHKRKHSWNRCLLFYLLGLLIPVTITIFAELMEMIQIQKSASLCGGVYYGDDFNSNENPDDWIRFFQKNREEWQVLEEYYEAIEGWNFDFVLFQQWDEEFVYYNHYISKNLQLKQEHPIYRFLKFTVENKDELEFNHLRVFVYGDYEKNIFHQSRILEVQFNVTSDWMQYDFIYSPNFLLDLDQIEGFRYMEVIGGGWYLVY